MLDRLKRRSSYANVVATMALFAALGGVAYAATALPKNSVGTKQLKKHSVTPSKVAAKTLQLFKGQKGDLGAQGPQGPGARSFNGDVPINNGFNTIAAANGIRVSMGCDQFGHINMRVEPASGDTSGFFAFGTQVLDGAQTVVSSDPAGIQENANQSIEVHVTVAASVANGPVKLTRFDFIETNSVPTACPYRGLIIPGDAAS